MLKNCRGDARYGPLLLVTGGGSPSVELELMPGDASLKGWRHHQGVAQIGGKRGGTVVIRPWKNRNRTSPAAITLGNGPTRGFTLKNYTTMPLEITGDASNCTVFSKGPIKQNEGSGIEITRDRE